MTSELLVFVPLRIEAAALKGQPGWTVLRSGMGPARARIAAARGLAVDAQAVAVVGLCAAVAPELRAGDVVCATELRREGAEPVPVPGSALLALEAAGERGDSLERAVRWLVETQRPDGTWHEPHYTGTGFPGDFYLNYHLYRQVFPVTALGRLLRSDGAAR